MHVGNTFILYSTLKCKTNQQHSHREDDVYKYTPIFTWMSVNRVLCPTSANLWIIKLCWNFNWNYVL